MLDELETKNTKIAEVYTCPHARKDNCDCKKPLLLLVNRALQKYALNRDECYVVGDSGKNDMLLARNARMKSILVLTGEGTESLTTTRDLWKEAKPTYVAENSLDAIDKIFES